MKMHPFAVPFGPKSLLTACLALLLFLPCYGEHSILEGTLEQSSVFPGTEHRYWVYVPEGYQSGQEACLFVGLDGILCGAPEVFDELISSGKMPMTIGVFIDPGKIKDGKGEVVRYNRSNEFDMTDSRFASFLEQELLPTAEGRVLNDGRKLKFSMRASDRAIFGLSSGGIAAFNAAFCRPDMFARVFSGVGTFVAFRGGNDLQALVRKTEPLPLRIFLQDGTFDAWNALFGSWYEANRLLESALQFAGYELKCDWGESGHNGNRATQIFRDVMVWLWEGWPQAPQRGVTQNDLLQPMLKDSSDWEFVGRQKVKRRNRGTFDAVYPDGSLAVRKEEGDNNLWQYVLDEKGKPLYGQRFYWLHNMDNHALHIGPMGFDDKGFLFVVTTCGVQICDQNGRVRGILRLPKATAAPVVALSIESGQLRLTDKEGNTFKRHLNIAPPQEGVRPASQGQG